MIGASKILTVSYGTFSCTLEGFDDPFNTMKAIAEYFRDLAAEDRYFGAEPPTPDAAMLHRIAEREVQRRVEARVQDNGVILRAGSAIGDAALPAAGAAVVAQPVAELQPVAPVVTEEAAVADPVQAVDFDIESEAATEVEVEAGPAPAAQPEVQTEAFAPAEMEPAAVVEETPAVAEVPQEVAVFEPATFEPAAEDVPELAPEYAPEPEEQARPGLASEMPEGVAAKLARLRQAVAASAPQAALAADEGFAAEHFEDEHADNAPLAEELDEVFAAVTDAPAESVADAAAGDVIAEAEPEVKEEAEPEVYTEAEAYAYAAPETDDADMLARLGATDDAAVTEAAPADPVAASAEVAADIDLAGLIATMSGGEAVETVATAPAEAAAFDPFADDSELDDDESLFDMADEPEAVDLPELAGDLNDDLPEGLLDDADDVADLAALDGDEPVHAEPAVEAPAMAEMPAPEEAPAAAAPETAPMAEAATIAAATAVAAEAAEKAQRARARVIKIRRAEVTPAAEPAAEAATAAPVASKDEDLNRLLRHAEDEMSEPENRRRLDAIQHLKAAVAATVADRRAGVKEPSDEERADPYRDDLARAVRPVRPRAGDGTRPTERPLADAVADRPAPVTPNGDRPAPLVLVSEQRIDRIAPSRVAPVRPRRLGGGAAPAAAVAQSPLDDTDPELEAELEAAMLANATSDADMADSDDDLGTDDAGEDTGNIFSDSRDFTEFADRLGATDLADLLEAAAAYATCVENRDHFTRPLLIRRIEAGALGEDYSREEGLVGFGKLLREGRIEKIRRGHYALTEKSTYLAEARKLAR